MVNTFFERAKKLSSTAQVLNSEMKCVKRTLLLMNGYPKWMIQNKKKKQHNGFSEVISEVLLPYTTDLGKSLKRIMEKTQQTNYLQIYRTFKTKHNPIFRKRYRTRQQMSYTAANVEM